MDDPLCHVLPIRVSPCLTPDHLALKWSLDNGHAYKRAIQRIYIESCFLVSLLILAEGDSYYVEPTRDTDVRITMCTEVRVTRSIIASSSDTRRL